MPPSDEDAGPSTAEGQRRTHTKSRNGCEPCKKRHTKCDELKPCCLQCLSRKISDQCRYVKPAKGRPRGKAAQKNSASQSPAGPSAPMMELSPPPATFHDFHICSPQHMAVHSSAEKPNSSSPSHANYIQNLADMGAIERSTSSPSTASDLWTDDFRVNEVHMQLLQDIVSPQGPRPLGKSIPIDFRSEMVQLAFKFPFLMHALLGHAALHLGAVDPSQRKSWDLQAIGFQTTSVSLFNNDRRHETNPGTDLEYNFAAYLFSTFISKHVLYHLLDAPTDDLGSILEGFAGFIRLQLGVPLLLGKGWEHSKPGVCTIRDMLQSYTDAVARLEAADMASPLLPLYDMLEKSGLDPDTHAIYQSAVRLLNLCYTADEEEISSIAVFVWPTRVNARFAADLSSERKPEALVILAYYAAILHRHRNTWLFGAGGGFVVEAIARYLGLRYAKWIQFPLEQVCGGELAFHY